MARFNITLSGTVAKKLDEDAKRQDIARSTLIAQYIEQHFEGKSEADVEAEIHQSRTESADSIQREHDEREKRAQKIIAEHETQLQQALIAEHEAELQQARADYEQQLQQINADNAATIQQFEDELHWLEAIAEKLTNDLKASEDEHEKRLQKRIAEHETEVQQALVAEHEAELQQARADYEQQLQQISTDNAATIQQFEDELHRLEVITQKLNDDLKTSEEREASLAEKPRQSETSKNTVVTALQQELSLSEQKATNLESSLRAETAATVQRERDENQKRLQTLRAEHEAELQQASVDYKKQVQQVNEKRIAEHKAELQKAYADYKKQIQQISTDKATTIKWFEDEYEGRAQKLIAEHEAELQQARADFEAKLRKVNADNAATLQQFAEEELERLKTIAKKRDNDLKASEEEHEKRLQELIAEHEAEMQQARADYEQLRKVNADNVTTIKRFEDELERLETLTEPWSLDDPRHEEIERIRHTMELIKDQIHRVIIGKDDLIEQLYLCLLAEGNVLLEGNPGIAKTHIAKLFARTLGCRFNRQQFTPDLLPADITGTYVFNRKTNEFEIRKGGIFANIVMVDEINRATPRTQAALLESMEERAVTIEGTTFPLEQPFMVIATEAPAGFEGTYPLPEVQLDRFTAKLNVGYPNADEELKIIDIKGKVEEGVVSVTDRGDLLQMIGIVRGIYVDAAVKRYIRDVVMSTRKRDDLALAASPRASIALLRLSKALAAVHGRSFVIPDDVKVVVPIVLSHRLVVAPRYDLDGTTPETITEEILNTVEIDAASALVPDR